MRRVPAPLFHARLVALAVVAGFVTRAAFGLVYWNDKPLTHDEREYLAQSDGDYDIGESYLTVSLGEPHNEACYKLIAAIMERAKS